ncbi:sarcospan-like [Antedon mediterranea]|uniref:sarcospan-like n=1 Tax=Antedon mediterranea TaxID=105859 RepID=UPI003AF48496
MYDKVAPDCNESNSSRSTGPLSLPHLSKSSRSSSSPELRFSPEVTTNPLMPAPTETTPPPPQTNCSTSSSAHQMHEPLKRTSTSSGTDKKYDLRCCTLPVCIVTLQILLGFIITTFGIVMLLMTPSIKHRDAPYWAGVLLMFAGIIGLYYSAIQNQVYFGSPRAFFVKTVCFGLSFCCVFINTIASAFCGIQANIIDSLHQNYQHVCDGDQNTVIANRDCVCTRREDNLIKHTYIFEEIADCRNFLLNLKTYLVFQCSLNAIGGLACFLVVIMMWRSRYMDFHSGLRFYSYSASIPSHPWSDRLSPPYEMFLMSESNNNNPTNSNPASPRPGNAR